MKLTKVISTITPHDTFFVLKVNRNGNTYCEGVLTFWVVAEVDNEEGDKFIDSFPFCAGDGQEVFSYIIENFTDKYVFHWSEMRQEMPKMKFYDGQFEQLNDFLEVLESGKR